MKKAVWLSLLLVPASAGAEELLPPLPAAEPALAATRAASSELARRTAAEARGRAGKPDPAAAQRVYDELFPNYAEVCTMTQLRTRGSKPGGKEAHANLFLHGACRDESAPRPQVKLCDASSDPADPRSGVGVSVNKVFADANWVAIPGRDMFFHGGLPAGTPLEDSAFEAAVRGAAAQPWFDGIELRPEVAAAAPAGMDPRELLVRKSIGTDFAMTVGRTVYCVRLPMPREALGAMVAYLNGRNAEKLARRLPWDPITNNCIHTVHNALAAAGVMPAKHTGGPGKLSHLHEEVASLFEALLGRLPDIALPANGFVRAFEAANERPIDDPDEAYADKDLRRTFERYRWVSTAPGGLVVTYSQAPQSPTDRFEPGPDPRMISLPVLWDKKAKFRELAHETPEDSSDLRANLEAYRERYARILAERSDTERGGKTGRFEREYYAYVEAQLRDVEAKLRAYDRLVGR